MESGGRHWSAIESIWETINIYDEQEDFLTTFSKVRREIGLLYAAQFCQSEVFNGGFTQFFSNSTGVLAPEAVEAFAAIGQVKVGEIVQKAMTLLGSPYLRERKARQNALEALRVATGSPQKRFAVAAFEPLENSFYDLLGTENGGYDSAADRYAAIIAGEMH